MGEVFERVVEVDDATFARLSLGITEEVRAEFMLLAVQVLLCFLPFKGQSCLKACVWVFEAFERKLGSPWLGSKSEEGSMNSQFCGHVIAGLQTSKAPNEQKVARCFGEK